MPQQEIGQAGELCADGLSFDLLILDEIVPGALFAEEAQVLLVHFGGGAVTQVVDAADGIAGVGQVLRHLLVPHDVLTHSVADLHHGAGLTLRQEQKPGELAFSVAGIQGKRFLFHGVLPHFFIVRQASARSTAVTCWASPAASTV